jgi:hypothetical protein
MCALVPFANALDCDLTVGMIGGREQFHLNPVRVIGVDAWDRVVDSHRDSRGNWFDYHTVAMTGGATYEDNVYDGMLLLNNNVDPASPPYRPILAKNLLFGDVGSSDTYRQRLAQRDQQSQENCTPRPEMQYRPIIWRP